MRDKIMQALKEINNLYGDYMFTNKNKFRAVLADVLPGSQNEPIRNLLNSAVGGMDVYSRLQNSANANSSVIIYNMTKEMNKRFFIPESVSLVAIECFAELLGMISNIYCERETSAKIHSRFPARSNLKLHQSRHQATDAGIVAKRYTIEAVIGSGDIFHVYRAYDNKLDRNVALKIMKEEYLTNVKMIERFTTEIRAAAELNHANIVKIYDHGRDADLQYVAQELIDGSSLKKIYRKDCV